MTTNLPIIIDGTTPVVSITTGNFANDAIYVYVQSIRNLPNIKPGFSITIRNADGPIPGIPFSGIPTGLRRIYISTFNGGDPDYSVKFSDGSDTVLLGSNAGDNFVITAKDDFTWLKEVVVIQGKTQLLNEDFTGYGTVVSSMTASSFSTTGSVYVQGTSIFRGTLIGLTTPTFVTGVSTFLFSTGILYTSSLSVLEGIDSKNIFASTVTAFSTINNNRISTITHYSQSTFTSSISFLDSTVPDTKYTLLTSTNTLYLVGEKGKIYTYQTLEQSGFSNISTQIAPTVDVKSVVSPLSSLNNIVNISLSNSRYDPGLSSFSEGTFKLLASLGANYGLTFLSNYFEKGLSSIAYTPGLSSLAFTTLIGLSTVSAVPGASNVSTIISQSLSSVNVQPGLSSISSIIGPGLSSITAFVPISSLSTNIAHSMSTVASEPGINNLFITIKSGLSTLVVHPGIYNLSSIYSYGVSSIAAGPGLSSLSTVIFSTASTFKSGQVISSFSTIASFGFSSLAAVTGYSSLIQTLTLGLSSIIDTGYIPYTSNLGEVMSTNATGRGTSSLLTTVSICFSTISDGPGLSSISSFFPRSLSAITVAVGLSTISTVISQGLSSILISMPFTSSYSTASTFVSSLYLRDLSSGQYSLIQLINEDLYVSSLHYPQRLDYLNSSTISTAFLEIKGLVSLSSIFTSSVYLNSSFTVVGLDSKNITTQSTLFSSIVLNDYLNNFSFPHLFGASNGLLFLQNKDGFPQFQNVGAQGISTMSTLFGYSYCNLTENVNLSNVSSSVGPALSSISLEPGLCNLEAYAFINVPSNKDVISTLNVFTSTASFYILNTTSFSTAYISTQIVSSQNLFVSSLQTTNAQISTFLSPLNMANQITGSLITTGYFSTGNLLVSSIEVSSMYIHNSNVYFSSISTGQLFVSTLNFGNFSTVFASSGLLYLQTHCNAGPGPFVRFDKSIVPNFMGYLRGLSVPSLYVSSIFTSTVIVSSSQNSFSLDTMAIISSGVYSTTINQLIVKPGISSLRDMTTYQNWNVAQMNASAQSIDSVANSNVLTFFGPTNTTRNGWRHGSGNQVTGYSMMSTLKNSGNTYALEWDGHKILAGGYDNTLGLNTYTVQQASNNIQLYIAPSSWTYNNTYSADGFGNFIRYAPGCVYPSGFPFSICRDICFNGNQYVAVGDAANSNATIKYSYDGVRWNDSMSGGFSNGSATTYFGGNGGFVVKWDGYKWVAGGCNLTGTTYAAIKYSYDGINWSNANQTRLTAPCRMDRLVYYNNSIWVGTGIFGDCNIKYSYDGINWSNCIWDGSAAGNVPAAAVITTASSNQSLVATQHFVTCSFAGLESNCTFLRSFDGIRFYLHSTNGNAWSTYIDEAYDGNFMVGYVNNNTPGPGITGAVNTMHTVKIMAPLPSSGRPDYGEGNFCLQGTTYPGQRGKTLVRSNVIPVLSMSNLMIYGSNFHNMAVSTNTIIGHANLCITGVEGSVVYHETDHFERQNYMNFNNILKIWGNLSTQVTINSPNNPNVKNNTLNLPRATLDVLCTINVRQATLLRRLKQVPAPFYPSSLGSADQCFDLYISGSTFMTNVAVGQGADSNAFFSTPISFFDIYNGGVGSFVTFRGTVSNNTTVGNLLNATSNAYNVTCYPMVTGVDKNLVYYWRNNNVNYRATDANGSGFFTGQHPTNCLDISQSTVNNYVGQLVSITTDGYTIYDLSGNKLTGKEAIQITNTSPITKLTTDDADPTVFGVVANCFNNGLQSDGTIDKYSESEFVTDLFGRIMVNCVGEGAIWVTNYGGNVSNGDYLCSCPIPGFSRKQDSGRLMNYTVAKATMSCDFNPPVISSINTFVLEGSTFSTIVSCLAYQCESVEYNGSSFMKAFIGCTYHCN